MSVSNSPSKYIANGTSLSSIADAIRAKTGGSGQLTFPAGFVDAIGSISGGGSGGGATVKTIHGTGPSDGFTDLTGWIRSDFSSNPPQTFVAGCIILYDQCFNMSINMETSNRIRGTWVDADGYESFAVLFNIAVSDQGVVHELLFDSVEYYVNGEQQEFDYFDYVGDWYIINVQA